MKTATAHPGESGLAHRVNSAATSASGAALCAALVCEATRIARHATHTVPRNAASALEWLIDRCLLARAAKVTIGRWSRRPIFVATESRSFLRSAARGQVEARPAIACCRLDRAWT